MNSATEGNAAGRLSSHKDAGSLGSFSKLINSVIFAVLTQQGIYSHCLNKPEVIQKKVSLSVFLGAGSPLTEAGLLQTSSLLHVCPVPLPGKAPQHPSCPLLPAAWINLLDTWVTHCPWWPHPNAQTPYAFPASFTGNALEETSVPAKDGLGAERMSSIEVKSLFSPQSIMKENLQQIFVFFLCHSYVQSQGRQGSEIGTVDQAVRTTGD